jgi:ArsR family transcriptional regulator
MLQHARRRCSDHHLENVEFIRSDLELIDRDLPTDCDCILLHFVLHQLASPANIIRLAASRLKPGGRLVIVDRISHEDESARNRFGPLWLGFEDSKIRQWSEAAGLQNLHHQIMRSVDPQQDHIPVFIAAGTRS